MKRDPRIDKIEQVIEQVLERDNFELVDIELNRAPVGLLLRIYMDTKEGGITLDELAKASRTINLVLDEADIIHQKYMLEVSSPGIERPLSKPEHFKRFVGSKVSIKTHKPIGKRKQFKGLIIEADDEGLVVETDKERYEIRYDNVSKARLQVDIEF